VCYEENLVYLYGEFLLFFIACFFTSIGTSTTASTSSAHPINSNTKKDKLTNNVLVVHSLLTQIVKKIQCTSSAQPINSNSKKDELTNNFLTCKIIDVHSINSNSKKDGLIFLRANPVLLAQIVKNMS
jgi:hypothetical protein